MSSATKKAIVNRILKQAKRSGTLIKASPHDEETCLQVLEDSCLFISGNKGIKFGYIKTNDPTGEPGGHEESGIQDHEIKPVVDYVTVQFCLAVQAPITAEMNKAAEIALNSLVDNASLCQPKMISPNIPAGQGNRPRSLSPRYILPDDDDISLVNNSDLELE